MRIVTSNGMLAPAGTSSKIFFEFDPACTAKGYCWDHMRVLPAYRVASQPGIWCMACGLIFMIVIFFDAISLAESAFFS